jgi:hypothetical protein
MDDRPIDDFIRARLTGAGWRLSWAEKIEGSAPFGMQRGRAANI